MQLYVDLQTIDYINELNILVDDINNGLGLSASGRCGDAYGALIGAYNGLNASSKTTFDTNTDLAYVAARERLAYLEIWTTLNPEVAAQGRELNNNNKIFVIIISAMSIAVLGAYYYLNKRRRLQ
ncbi:MAG: hypothetical protein GX350_04050 [Erysipelotrichaceae bacterium]|nr:hypothetical protein [Erysipelotrichaceae bacterium]